MGGIAAGAAAGAAVGAAATAPSWVPRQSESDAAIGAQRSEQSFERSQRPAPMPASPSTTTPSHTVPSGGWTRSPDTAPARETPSGWGRAEAPRYRTPERPSYAPPPPAYSGMDPLTMILLLNALQSSQDAQRFRSEPHYQEWRKEADRLAQDNADLRQKLERLDASAVNPPTAAAPATAAPRANTSTPQTPVASAQGGSGMRIFLILLLMLALGGAGFMWYSYMRKPKSAPRVQTTRTPEPDVDHLSHLRVGAGVSAPIATMVLADSGPQPLHVQDLPNDMILQEVGAVSGLGTQAKIGVIDDRHFVLATASAKSSTTRLFQIKDVITPASDDEWRFWLDPNDVDRDGDRGYIGQPIFESQNGVAFMRVWSPGANPVQAQTFEGIGQQWQGMLYARPLEGVDGQEEYALIAVHRERPGHRRVLVCFGLEIASSDIR